MPTQDNSGDIFLGRCSSGAIPSVFVYTSLSGWRHDDTCSFCGGLRPSVALACFKSGAELSPTDKSYKMYIEGGTVPHATTKCYTNHFSESQALELVGLIERKQIKIGYPGRLYSGLDFGCYKEALS